MQQRLRCELSEHDSASTLLSSGSELRHQHLPNRPSVSVTCRSFEAVFAEITINGGCTTCNTCPSNAYQNAPCTSTQQPVCTCQKLFCVSQLSHCSLDTAACSAAGLGVHCNTCIPSKCTSCVGGYYLNPLAYPTCQPCPVRCGSSC